MKKAGLFSIGTKDAIKGFILAVITAVVTVLYTSIQSGGLTFDWKIIGATALTAALGYIIKNFLTNSSDQFLTKDTPPGK